MKISSGNERPKISIYLLIAIIGFIAVHIGFATTFLIPMTKGTFEAPAIIYIHGMVAFAWVLLFLVQTFLIHRSQYKLHMTLGFTGIVIALATSITMIPAAMFGVEKELAAGLGQTAISGIVGNCTSSIMFLSLALSGVAYRKRPDIHKRLLLLATIVVLWPAWFRFRHYFPSVERPDIWFAVVLADSLIILAWIWEKSTTNRIHPVLKYGGIFIIAEHAFEVIMFDTAGWRIIANVIYGSLQ